MLENQKWIHFEDDILVEWQQSKDEGKLIDDLEEACIKISAMPRSQEKTEAAEDIWKLIEASPADEGFIYTEPSDLEGIRDERPSKSYIFVNALTDEQLVDKLTGAWIGRISGCLLGKPIEGYRRERLVKLLKGTDNFPLVYYILKEKFTDELVEELSIKKDSCWADNINGIAPVDDDTNYTVFTLKLIEKFGKDFRPNDILEAWLGWIPMLATCTAERAAYRNAAAGLLAPQTALNKNPYREWIGAQIRGDFFGYINIADTEKSANMAWRDASVSHVKNGIYGEMFVAAMIAAAAVCDDVLTVIEAGLDEIPQNSRLRRDVDLVLEWYDNALSFEKMTDNIHTLYDEAQSHGWCHTNPNAMIVIAAMLCGNKDFGKSICLAVQAAFDTDCNGATVGSIMGIMLGAKNIPDCWTKPYNSKLSTSINEYTEVTIQELVEKTIKIINSK
ncbi:MAG: ADP-ribosylglycohydrolase family protein [Eubacteriales bacterium]